MPPPNLPTGASSEETDSVLPKSYIRTMSQDTQRLQGGNDQKPVLSSGKVLWPSGGNVLSGNPLSTTPAQNNTAHSPSLPSQAPSSVTQNMNAPLTQPPPPKQKEGFLASFLRPTGNHGSPLSTPTGRAPASSHNENPPSPERQSQETIWDARVPQIQAQAGVKKAITPLSQKAVPQKPLTPVKEAVQVSAPMKNPVQPISSVAKPTIFSPRLPVSPLAPRALSPTPVPSTPTPLRTPDPRKQASIETIIRKEDSTPRVPPSRREEPPLSNASSHHEEDIGIDLGISDYLKGGPTFQIAQSSAPIPLQPLVKSTREAPQAPGIIRGSGGLGGIWSPPEVKISPQVARVEPKTPEEKGRSNLPPNGKTLSTSQESTSIFSPGTSSQGKGSEKFPPAHSVSAPRESNADLEAEKAQLEGERAQITGKKSVIESDVVKLMSQKQNVEAELRPILERVQSAAKAVEECESKESGLQGEMRRGVEKEKWAKVEERRKVEQEMLVVKRKLADSENIIKAKEDEELMLVKREKEIDARIDWIGKEGKRREIEGKLREVMREKTNVESHRTILDNSVKRLRTSLEESEKNEQRLVAEKKALGEKAPKTIQEEEEISQKRYDIEKQLHDVELRRWNIEDEYKKAVELFAKEDMSYLEASHKVTELEDTLKALG